MNKRTCLYDKHVALGALISPFGGFDMPIQYSSIIDEHNAVRQHCGVFDVSHMGEVRVTGAEHQTMQVFSMTGRKVAEYAIDANDKTVTLNVPRGWYAVRIGNEVARKIYVP